MKFQLLYKSLHDILAGFNQEEKFLHNIRKTINNIIEEIPVEKEIILRPYGTTTKWLVNEFDFGQHRVSCFDKNKDNAMNLGVKIYNEYSFEIKEAIIINTSFKYRKEIVNELKKEKVKYIDLFDCFEKNNLYLKSNPEEYRMTTHAIPNYYYMRWKNDKSETRLRELLLALVEAYDFFLLEEVCKETMSEFSFVRDVYTAYCKLIDEIYLQLRLRENMNDIIVHWLDAVPYCWMDRLPKISKLVSNGLFFENTYSCTPYTHQTLRAMISGILPLNDFEESIKLIDESSYGIQWLEKKNYLFKQIGHDGEGVNSCIEKYTYNFDKNVSCNYIYWKCIEEIIKSNKPVFLIAHMVVETHPPMVSTKLHDIEYNLSSDNYVLQRDISYKYIDERVIFYKELFDYRKQIILSDHGEHISKYPERYWMQNKLHTWCLVLGTEKINVVENRLFPYYNFMKLIDYIINSDEAKYDDIFEDYILFQDTDYYNNSAIDIFIKEGIADYAIAYTGILDSKNKYVVNGIGEEFYYRIENDMDYELEYEQGNIVCEYLKRKLKVKFPDSSGFEMFKYSKKLYEELTR